MYYLVSSSEHHPDRPRRQLIVANDRQHARELAQAQLGDAFTLESWHDIQIAEHQAHIRLIKAMQDKSELEARREGPVAELHALEADEAEARAEADGAAERKAFFHKALRSLLAGLAKATD
ncbi:MAG TPA: hypothetical protein PK668_27495 [Myxococcota bacterium]|nr:hypothetical protein [Myxococcota bacterium]HRY97273.1 hypothetical protein [Myxococcota bacterium]